MIRTDAATATATVPDLPDRISDIEAGKDSPEPTVRSSASDFAQPTGGRSPSASSFLQ